MPIPFEDDLIEAYLRALKTVVRLEVEVGEAQERALRASLLSGSLARLREIRFPNAAPDFIERVDAGVLAFDRAARVEKETERLAREELAAADNRTALLRLRIEIEIGRIPLLQLTGAGLTADFRPLFAETLREVELEAKMAAMDRGAARVDVEAAEAVNRPEVVLATRERLAERASNVAGLISRADRVARLADEFLAQTRLLDNPALLSTERAAIARRIFEISTEVSAAREEAKRVREVGQQPLGIARESTNVNAIRGRIIMDGIEVADLVIRALGGLEELGRFPARLRETLSRAALIRRPVQVQRAAQRAP